MPDSFPHYTHTSPGPGGLLLSGISFGSGLVRARYTMYERHGMSQTPEHGAWGLMKNRCFNPADRYYCDYGGRGITVCKTWRKSFVAFYEHVGPRPSNKHSIDRIDNNGNYEPGNVRWASTMVQQQNKRNIVWISHNGETRCAKEWSRITGINYQTIRSRIKSGYSSEVVLSTSYIRNTRPERN